MRIFTAKDLMAAEKESMAREGITSTELMERAADLVFRYVHALVEDTETKVKVFCGIGNNGGDGLAVSRKLIEAGVDVEVYVVNFSNKRSQDFLIQYDLIKSRTGKWPVVLNKQDEVPGIEPGDIVVDAIFGIGLNRPVPRWVGGLIQNINDSFNYYTLSIDVPSGMFVDEPTPNGSPILKAHTTLTFHAPKLPFFFPDTGPAAGNFFVLDLDLDPEVFDEYEVVGTYIERPLIQNIYKLRNRFSHKGTYGHALLIGGSNGKMGSIYLSAAACLRVGAGMASTYIPQCGSQIMQISLPEAMVITGKGIQYIEDIKYDIEPRAICFGPGAGTNPETAEAFRDLIENAKGPLVIDADGLNLLVEDSDLFEILPAGSILTPHPKELERLIGSWENDFEKLEKAWDFSMAFDLILVMKDAFTMTLSRGQVFVNSTGNAGMATAGSGDVLAGVITGLLAQGHPPEIAAVFGVYLHGLAGDIASREYSPEAMLAGDIVTCLGKAYRNLYNDLIDDVDDEDWDFDPGL